MRVICAEVDVAAGSAAQAARHRRIQERIAGRFSKPLATCMSAKAARAASEIYDAPVNRWYWLLVVPVVVPLLTVVYNRVEPRLFGFPCFYWMQLGYVFLGCAVCWIVYRKTRGQ